MKIESLIIFLSVMMILLAFNRAFAANTLALTGVGGTAAPTSTSTPTPTATNNSNPDT